MTIHDASVNEDWRPEAAAMRHVRYRESGRSLDRGSVDVRDR